MDAIYYALERAARSFVRTKLARALDGTKYKGQTTGSNKVAARRGG